jgi:hypothetical protein
MQIDTLLPFRTICRSTHYDHFVQYADWYIIWPFRTICRLTHMTISNHIKKHIMTISYLMQIDTLWPFRTICRSTHYDHFVPYADRYIITISYHMQIDTLWEAVQSLIPNATIKGCSFHWGQAIWRHVQSLGLQVKFLIYFTLYMSTSQYRLKSYDS